MTTTDELAGLDPDGETIDQWDRWPGEPPASFKHFEAYRLMGRARTLRRMAEEHQISHGYAQHMSAEWRWVSRAEAWDREQARVYAARMLDRRYEVGEQHLTVANLLLSKAVTRLRDLDPAKLNARDLLAYIEASIKVQRMVLGESTERIEHVTTPAGEDLELEELSDEQLEEHLGGLYVEIGRRIQHPGAVADAVEHAEA